MYRALRLESLENRQIALLIPLTAVAGIVDSVSFLGLGGVFTSNMTGNWVVLAFALSGEHVFDVLRLGLSFAGFLIGALLAGRLARTAWGNGHAGWPSSVTASLSLSAVIQVAVLTVWLAAGDTPPKTCFAFLLALSMGLQAGAVRVLGVADMPTVVITSTVIGLSGDLPFGTGRSERWRRRTGGIAAFFLGGLVGALLGRIDRPLGLVPSIAVLVTVMLSSGYLFPQRVQAGSEAPPAEPSESAN